MILRVLVACGGFSYGDVLGAGGGWANTILISMTTLRQPVWRLLSITKMSLLLGVCNGCQTLSLLSSLIPGR